MFKTARPVFAKGKEKEMNYQLLLKASLSSLKDVKLYITASSFYRLTINGSFAFFGPARAAIGHARVDVVDLSDYDSKNGDKNNDIIIEVAGYYCKSLATVRQLSFVQAELRCGEEVLLATGENRPDFEAFCNVQRKQKADRYSMQRHFNEVWDLRNADIFADKNKVVLCEVDNSLSYLKSTPNPDFSCVDVDKCASRGSFVFDETLAYRENRYSGNQTPERMIKDDWGAYLNEEVFSRPYP